MFKGPQLQKQVKLSYGILCSACCLMVLYICEKFHKNILNGFQLTERTQVHGRNGYVQSIITPKAGKPELRFMCSACRLIVLYICVKFCENIQQAQVHRVKFGEHILDAIRVMERTQMMEEPTDGLRGRRTLKISEGT